MNNHWGYAVADHAWKPPRQLLRKVVERASKGGNLILNVGPDECPRSIPLESVRTLSASAPGSPPTERASTSAGGAAVFPGPSGVVSPPRNGREALRPCILSCPFGSLALPGLGGGRSRACGCWRMDPSFGKMMPGTPKSFGSRFRGTSANRLISPFRFRMRTTGELNRTPASPRHSSACWGRGRGSLSTHGGRSCLRFPRIALACAGRIGAPGRAERGTHVPRSDGTFIPLPASWGPASVASIGYREKASFRLLKEMLVTHLSSAFTEKWL